MDQEENELLTQIGPGTTMGKLMREYWIPALLSSEIAEPDCDPVRVMLLGEKLIAFRDTQGKIGLVGNFCPHRGASLFFGRNEECGLRCVYHGWKYDVDGNCVDLPNEPPTSKFKEHIKAVSYPCVDRGGVVWTYMGTREVPPSLPDLEGNQLPDERRLVWAVMRNCNWFQALEGDIDTSHQGFLHHGSLKPEEAKAGSFQYYIAQDRAPRYVWEDTDYGELYGAYRPAGDGRKYWRLAEFLFPFYTNPPQGVLGYHIFNRAWVPMDDTHTMVFTMEQKTRQEGFEMHPNGTGWFERHRLVQDEENDYLMDREIQRRSSYSTDGPTSWTGIKGILVQDQAVTESMGQISDRTREHLGSADMMCVTVRRQIMTAAKVLVEDGVTPPGVDDPAAYRVRAGGVILPEEADWIEATEDLREAYIDHPEIDPRAVRGF